jgi:hypothetical protein
MLDDPRLPQRYWDKISPEPTTGCWLWTAFDQEGYGRFGWRGSVKLAHRVAYEELVGPVPDGLQLDHLCRVRQCCNPLHLEAVPQHVNRERGNYRLGGEKAGAMKRAITHCPRGHEYAGDNLRVTKRGHRKCITCEKLRYREHAPVAVGYRGNRDRSNPRRSAANPGNPVGGKSGVPGA